MPTWLIILMSVGVPMAVLFGVLGMIVGKARRRVRRTIMERWRRDQVRRLDERANFAGRQSGSRLRGNGALVLTDDELAFFMWLPARELVIPTAAITKVELRRSFLGRAAPWRMLCVHWRTDTGEDAAAWALADVDDWHQALLNVAPNAVGEEEEKA